MLESMWINKLKVFKRYLKYSRHFKKLLKMQNIPNDKIEGEEEYVAYWRRLSRHVERYSYRFFSHYCGLSKYIVPEDIGHSYIEALFNPKEKTGYWEDKSLFPTYLPTGSAPQTILCRQNGGEILDSKVAKLAAINLSSNATKIACYIARIVQGGGDFKTFER